MNQLLLIGLGSLIVVILMNNKNNKKNTSSMLSTKSKNSNCNIMILVFIGFLVFVMVNKKSVLEGFSENENINNHFLCVTETLDSTECLYNSVNLFLTDEQKTTITKNGLVNTKQTDQQRDRPTPPPNPTPARTTPPARTAPTPPSDQNKSG